MDFAALLPLSIVSIIFFSLFIFTGIRSYKRRFKLNYDLRNTFPYELNYHTKFFDNIVPNIFLVLSIACSIVIYIFFDVKNLIGVNVFILISGIFLSLLSFALVFVDLKYLRTHIALMVFTSVFSFGLGASNAIGNFVKWQNTQNIYYIILCVICGGFALISFAVMMNPKLSLNIKMDSKIDENGKEILIRPKYIVLAFSEWLLIISLYINQLLLVLSQIK